MCDELVSVGRSLVPASPALLQAVTTHVQASHNTMERCYSEHIPLKFVFGAINSMMYFTHQLESMDIPGNFLDKAEEYFYVVPKPRCTGGFTPDRLSPHLDVQLCLGQYPQSSEPSMERSKTPPPPQLVLPPASRVHRRSLSSGYPIGHAPKPTSPGQVTSVCGSESDVACLHVTEVGSGYEGGQSEDTTSVSEAIKGSLSQVLGVVETKAWIVLRVLSNQVDLYFQLRSSEQVDETVLLDLKTVCDQVLETVKLICHRTNQWFLLKDMLDTHICSPYLLPESASEAWVEKVVQQQGRTEPFTAQEFMCDLYHSFHITPHWRIKEQKGRLVSKTSLKE